MQECKMMIVKIF